MCAVELTLRLVPNLLKVMKGERAEFTCLSLTESNWEVPDWSDGKEELPNNTNLIQQNSTAEVLAIDAAQMLNSGGYTCIGEDVKTQEPFTAVGKLVVISSIEGN